jgi:potassium channel subfamily K, other eukaryote
MSASTNDATDVTRTPLSRSLPEQRRAPENEPFFFGIPIVGFFRPPSAPSNADERTPLMMHNRRSKIVQSHRTWQESPPRRGRMHQQTFRQSERPSIAAYNKTRPPEWPRISPNRRRRSAQELWAIVRYHVHHETLHINSDCWRRDGEDHRPSLFTQTEDISQENFREMVLPYDFTVRDCFVALAVYLSISIVAYSFVFEHWSIIDSMYFACVSFTTIGYGDLSPSTTAGRFFCIFFALGGVAVLAIALGVLGSRIVESEVQAMDVTKMKLVDELVSLLPSKVNPKILLHSSSSQEGRTHSSFDYLRDFDDPHIHDDFDDYNVSSRWAQCKEFCSLFGSLLCRYGPALTPLFIGSLIIGHNEGWSIVDSFYYCVVTTTTIGYGDRVPQHESMKLFAVLFIPLSVGAMGHFLGTIANFIVEQRRKAYDKQLWKHELTLQDLQYMSSSNDGVVTELDFVVFMLQAMKKVDKELIDHIRNHFHLLDLTHSNTLCRSDLELMAQKKLRSVKTKLRMSTYRQSLLSMKSSSMEDTATELTTAMELAAAMDGEIAPVKGAINGITRATKPFKQ